jgi:hypothetical protein
VALITAATALVFTLLVGISFQIRWLVLLQRILVSVAFFSMIGYFVGSWLECRLRLLFPESKKGQKCDVVSSPVKDGLTSFDPFTSNSFEHIERK